MIVFADVDVLKKMACCGFLELLSDLVGADPAELECYHLPSLPYRLRKRTLGQLSPEAQASLLAFCGRHRPVPGDVALDRQDELIEAGMDPGEATLIAVAEELGGVVMTGDKRAILFYSRISCGVEGRNVAFICWEQLLQEVHRQHGFARLKAGGCAAGEVDGLLKLAFSSGMDTTEDHALDCITSYLNDLRLQVPDLIYPVPPAR